MELFFATDRMGVGDSVELQVTTDNSLVQTFSFKVVERGAASRALIWYNPNGGIERYVFSHCFKLGYDVDVQDVSGVNSLRLRSVNGRVRSRLCSGYESGVEAERVAQILLSPVVFLDKKDSAEVVELESRSVEFDSKGQLHSLTFDISEEWKGGVL